MSVFRVSCGVGHRSDLGTLAGVVRWVKRGASLDRVGALHDAINKKQAWLVKAFLRLGADVNHQELSGLTPTHEALDDAACLKV